MVYHAVTRTVSGHTVPESSTKAIEKKLMGREKEKIEPEVGICYHIKCYV